MARPARAVRARARPCSGTPTAAWSPPPRPRAADGLAGWCSTSRRWAACSPRRTLARALPRRGSPPATASAPSRDFLADVGGYSEAEIDAMRGTPVWEARLAIVPTVDPRARAENAYRLPVEALGRSGCPTLMLVGSGEPGLGAPLDRGLRGGDPRRRGRDARGPGARRHRRGARARGRRAAALG